jgi:hypothetical protein
MTTPLEKLQRPQFVSPPIVDGRSLSNQFAGRTTLASGSATVTVSTTNARSDMVLTHMIEAALAAQFVTQGRVDIVSGAAYGTASTTAATSGMVVGIAGDALNVASGFGRALKINSVVDGVSFAIGTQDGLGPGASMGLMWKIHGKDPAVISVQTISDGNFFTLGWADGQARPYGSTLHWSILRTN